ncbi:MAG: glutamine synthetase family protein [Desulfobacteraceae bacterium]
MEVKAEIKKEVEGVEFVKIFFTDLNGRLMTLPVNAEDIETIADDGIGFDGSSIAGYGSVDKSDRLLVPDLDTFRVLDFKGDRAGFVIGNIFDENGQRAGADSRALLEKIIDYAREKYGFTFAMGPEYEFFILNGKEFGQKAFSDNAGYFHSTPHDKGEQIRNRIIRILKQCGIKSEKAHHEVTPSQHEINIECTDPLTAADQTVLFKYVAQKVALEEEHYNITFMPKPFEGYNRNAFHIHLSVVDQNRTNLFYDSSNKYLLSRTARQFIAGILKYARETSIVMASTFNSYKAYVMGREAPISRGWGLKNRSSMVRIPFSKNPKATRIELRSPDPAGNVYMQMAVLIAMGIAGIEENLTCPEPDIGNAYLNNTNVAMWDERFLPKSIFEALVEAERSSFLKKTLGDEIYTNYMDIKKEDWEDHRVHITHKEYQKYLNV